MLVIAEAEIDVSVGKCRVEPERNVTERAKNGAASPRFPNRSNRAALLQRNNILTDAAADAGDRAWFMMTGAGLNPDCRSVCRTISP